MTRLGLHCSSGGELVTLIRLYIWVLYGTRILQAIQLSNWLPDNACNYVNY